MLQFKTAELLFKMFEVDTMRIIKEDHFRGTMQEKLLELGMWEVITEAHENGAVLDEEQLFVILAGETVHNFDDDVDFFFDLALKLYRTLKLSMRCI
ncbi:hypothetical protein Tco_0191571 [Tanacetum coccineum]